MPCNPIKCHHVPEGTALLVIFSICVCVTLALRVWQYHELKLFQHFGLYCCSHIYPEDDPNVYRNTAMASRYKVTKLWKPTLHIRNHNWYILLPFQLYHTVHVPNQLSRSSSGIIATNSGRLGFDPIQVISTFFVWFYSIPKWRY